MDYDEILKKIKDKAKLSDEDVQKRITEKQRELSNLVSKDGAAYIIAKELGVELFPAKTQRRLQIKNIVPKIRVLNINARIVRIFPIKEFESKGRKGKVASIILGDESGTIRLTLWDAQTEIVEKVKEGMAVEVFGGYTREDQRGGAEIRLSKSGGLKILEDSDLPEITQMKAPETSRKTESSIEKLQEGDMTEIRAAVVQLFETNFFYTVCPECGKRVTKDNDYTCADHGKVEPKKNIVISGVVDDGTGNIRVVFFRDNALKLIGLDMDQVIERQDSFFNDLDILGKEFVISGRVRRNKMFKRLEFVANDVKEVNVQEQATKLINNLKVNK